MSKVLNLTIIGLLMTTTAMGARRLGSKPKISSAEILAAFELDGTTGSNYLAPDDPAWDSMTCD